MSVHKAITAHSQKQNTIVTTFARLEEQREHEIEKVVDLCKSGLPFTTDRINRFTNEINEVAKEGLTPNRKLVTDEMVKEYVERLSNR
ncbi:hypothetical protein Q75_04195 [Bacillus coahuilensis p1.1.43]|uniref:Uncharacterized protein n=1 Tax=Bacillus coahuilensis p1.1.43 TaxID=1150625 RepID=A0A147KAI4_9BACI|nr:YpbS family protein [Bacillus coahuilensis]KUP07711.1 hypothetical protein Q75_04195 [Bacillus coahuilensis p1.1.43]